MAARSLDRFGRAPIAPANVGARVTTKCSGMRERNPFEKFHGCRRSYTGATSSAMASTQRDVGGTDSAEQLQHAPPASDHHERVFAIDDRKDALGSNVSFEHRLAAPCVSPTRSRQIGRAPRGSIVGGLSLAVSAQT